MNRYYVEIVRDDTGDVIKRIGPMTERQADRVEDGVLINLDHSQFSTRIVEETEGNPSK